MRRRVSLIAVAMAIAIAVWFWWPRPLAEIVPADPNPFVTSLTIIPIEVDHDAPPPRITLPNGVSVENTERVPVRVAIHDPTSWSDTVEIAANIGQYVQIELDRSDSFPESIDGQEVASSDRWPITLAVYRRGDDPDDAKEFQCMVPDGTIEPPPRGEGHLHPPPRPVHAGVPEFRSEYGFEGIPDIEPADEGHNRYWTFIFPPDEEEPEGEYVYEVRLYPTARWVSAIRSEKGEPIVLRRGLLIAVDSDEAPSAAESNESG